MWRRICGQSLLLVGRALHQWLPDLPPTTRVGIFPLHLDPPTLRHIDVFHALLGERPEQLCQIATGVDGPLGRDDSFRRGKDGKAEDEGERSLKGKRERERTKGEEWSVRSLLPLDHLVVLPTARYDGDISQSLYLSAMSVLATRDLERVDVSLEAVEHPDDTMPLLGTLVERYPSAVIVYWLPNASDILRWVNFEYLQSHVPFVFLTPLGYRVGCRAELERRRGMEGVELKKVNDGSGEAPVFCDKLHRMRLQSKDFENGTVPSFIDVGCASAEREERGLQSRGDEPEDEMEDSFIDNVAFCALRRHQEGATENRIHWGQSDAAWRDENSTVDVLRATTEESGYEKLQRRRLEDPLSVSEDLLPHRYELYEVEWRKGAELRRMLFEQRFRDAPGLLSEPVLQFILAHRLYREYDPRSPGNGGERISDKSVGVNLSAGGGVTEASNAGELKLATIAPRLELHYDENNPVAEEQYRWLKDYECTEGCPDLIVPIGGDGFMMRCIRKYWQRFIPFFGVNAGRAGYLLNTASSLEELFLAPLRVYLLPMLHCTATVLPPSLEEAHADLMDDVNMSAKWELEEGGNDSFPEDPRPMVREELAFNDAWLERSSGQTASIEIAVNGIVRMREVRGDGVLISTPAGSTAYSKALGASPIPAHVPLVQLVGSNIVYPPQWRPVNLDRKDIIELRCLDVKKRPCRGFVDSVDIGNVHTMRVRASRVAGVQLCFSQSCDLQSKLYIVQFPRGY